MSSKTQRKVSQKTFEQPQIRFLTILNIHRSFLLIGHSKHELFWPEILCCFIELRVSLRYNFTHPTHINTISHTKVLATFMI